MKKAINKKELTIPKKEKITYLIDLEDYDNVREYLEDNGDLNIIFDAGVRSTKQLISLKLQVCNISCGIFELEGISQFEKWLNKNKELSSELEPVLIQVINRIKNYGQFCFCLCSNNTGTPLINQVLTNISSTTTEIRRNPNSGNNILIWII